MSMTFSAPSRIHLTPRSSLRSFRALNWRSFCQSFKEPTITYKIINYSSNDKREGRHTTMAIAIIMATPSTQSTGGWSLALGVPKSWKSPRAREIRAAIERRIYSMDKRQDKGQGYRKTHQNFVLHSVGHEL